MKKYIWLLFMVIYLVGCQAKPIFSQNHLKIIVTSDIHYFLKDYYKDCEWFEESMMYGDGKMVTYADEILDQFEKAVVEMKPDLLIMTGDMTFNGERESHEAVAKRLEKISNHGIKVAVIPGNHDIDNIYAKGYGKDDYFDVENITSKDFTNIYKNCGYHIASQKHSDSLSYVVPLNEQYTLLMMDSNNHDLTGGLAVDSGGKFPEKTMSWLKKQLVSIQKEGKIPIVAMHHNLIHHSEMLNAGYTINNSEEVIQLFKEYNVPFVLSGHIHCQNVQEVNGIYDIASSSLLDAPLQYGVIELDNKRLSYHTQSLKISKDSIQYFKDVSMNKMKERFKDIKDDQIRQEAIETMALVNYHYFAGTICEIKEDVKKMNGYQTIMNMEDDFIKHYMKSMMDSDINHTSLDIDL